MLNVLNTYRKSHKFLVSGGALAVKSISRKSLLHFPTFHPFPSIWGWTRVAIFHHCQFVRQFSLCEPYFRKTTKLSAKAFPCYFKGFAQFCVKIPYTCGESHCINFRGLVDNFALKMMSWKKASAAVDLSGLTPREVARGALTCAEFQNMPDLLDDDPFGPFVVKAEVRNRLLYFWIVNVEHVDILDKIHFIYVRGSIWWRTKVNRGMSWEIPWDWWSCHRRRKRNRRQRRIRRWRGYMKREKRRRGKY